MEKFVKQEIRCVECGDMLERYAGILVNDGVICVSCLDEIVDIFESGDVGVLDFLGVKAI